MSSVFFNKGENCIAAGRLFVEETVHDQFVKKVVRVSLAIFSVGNVLVGLIGGWVGGWMMDGWLVG